MNLTKTSKFIKMVSSFVLVICTMTNILFTSFATANISTGTFGTNANSMVGTYDSFNTDNFFTSLFFDLSLVITLSVCALLFACMYQFLLLLFDKKEIIFDKIISFVFELVHLALNVY